ncbi:MAG: hypothetical protein JKY74_12525 [Shewanella sp.]|nr:hypothetical protein [Shewanella sp.]
MENFPRTTNKVLIKILDDLYELYKASPKSLLLAAEQAAIKAGILYNYDDTTSARHQFDELKSKMSRRGQKKGVSLFVYLSEQLLINLKVQLLPGFNIEDLLKLLKIELSEHSYLYLSKENIWRVCWKLNIDNEDEFLEISVRAGGDIDKPVVPNYVYENIEQGIGAYTKGTNGVALSLLSISLESSLRDALVTLGYDYSSSGSSSDVYHMAKVRFSKDGNSFKVNPLEVMPKSIDTFVGGDIEVNIKRAKNSKGKWYLKLTSGAGDLMDFISKDTFDTGGAKSVTGLGAALDIARNDEKIIKNHMFPLDLDSPVKAIRNNLIHLSGEAMNTEVHEGNTLQQFLSSPDRVFDTIKSITDVVEDLYTRIADESLEGSAD